jgi:hypothetical protein
LLAGAVLGCEVGSATPARTTARDSAGVRIIATKVPTKGGARWALSAKPVLRIETAEDSAGFVFHAPIYPIHVSPNSIVFAPQGPPRGGPGRGYGLAPVAKLGVFDTKGKLLRRFGRSGKGPGEFTAIERAFALPSDSLLILDAAGTATVMTLTGRYVRKFDFPFPRITAEVLGPFDDGSIAVGIPDRSTGDSMRFTRIAYARFSRAGKKLNDLTPPLPFFPRKSRTWSPRASAAISDNTLYYTAGDSPEVRSYSASGALTRILRMDLEPRASTAVHRKRYQQLLAQHLGYLGLQPSASAPEYESRLPAIEQMLVDSEGCLWLREGSVHPFWDGADWLVVDSQGQFVARASTPTGFVVTEIGRDYVLGACENDDGSSSVCEFSLSRH